MFQRLSNTLGNLAALAYFILPMTIIILALLMVPLTFLSEVNTIMESGFAGPNHFLPIVGMCGFFSAISLLVPPLRKMYHVLPWLYPFIKIFLASAVILAVALGILNYGYEVVDPRRHSLYLGIMIGQLMICRLAMSLYFRWKPARLYTEESYHG